TKDCAVCRLFVFMDQCHAGVFLPVARDGNHANMAMAAVAGANKYSISREYNRGWYEEWSKRNFDLSKKTMSQWHDLAFSWTSLGGMAFGPDHWAEGTKGNGNANLCDCCETPPGAPRNGADRTGACSTTILEGYADRTPLPGTPETGSVSLRFPAYDGIALAGDDTLTFATRPDGSTYVTVSSGGGLPGPDGAEVAFYTAAAVPGGSASYKIMSPGAAPMASLGCPAGGLRGGVPVPERFDVKNVGGSAGDFQCMLSDTRGWIA